MARCKDCVHYEACSAFSKIINSAREVEKGCEYFKDRTKYVEVVRCNDCKHCKKYRNRLDPMLNHQLCVRMDNYAFGVEEDDFCSYGERRTDGN